jgi:WD40 repeat protein
VAFSRDGRAIVFREDSGSAEQPWLTSVGLEGDYPLVRRSAHPTFDPTPFTNPDGSLYVVHRVLRADDGTELFRLSTREGKTEVQGVFDPRGNRVVTSGPAGMHIWAVPSGELLKTYGEGDTSAVAFSPSGWFVIGAFGNDARIWDTLDDRTVRLSGHKGTVHSVTFSNDGRLVATAGDDTTGRIWNPVDGTELTTLRGHEKRVWSIRFDRDSPLVATASEDGTAKLWSTDGGRLLATIRAARPVIWAVFSPTGDRIAISEQAEGGHVAVRVYTVESLIGKRPPPSAK